VPQDVPSQPVFVALCLPVPSAQDVILEPERFELREAIQQPVRVGTELVDRFEDEGRVLSELALGFAGSDRLHSLRGRDPHVLGEDRLGRVAPRLADERARFQGAIVGQGLPVERTDNVRRSERKDALEHGLVQSENDRHVFLLQLGGECGAGLERRTTGILLISRSLIHGP
jgi:hypothetical protein